MIKRISIGLGLGICLMAFQPDPFLLSKERGKRVYKMNCQTCHADDGRGVEGIFPPLAASDYLMQNRARAIRQVLYGAKGMMTVNGATYTGEMPAQGGLTNEQIADVLNYIRNTWSNRDNAMITPQEVQAQRK